jgi:antibiotic biosynthesis monooxygenase (ABM) superfamily enzyme
VLPPSHSRQPIYTYIFHFDDPLHLKRWEDSQERRAWVSQLDEWIEAPAAKQVVTGLEYWFQLPADAGSVPAPRYKMAVVTISAIFPLSLLIAEALNPHLLHLPIAVRSLLTACLLVIPMTCVVMPVMTKLFAPWLFTERRQP